MLAVLLLAGCATTSAVVKPVEASPAPVAAPPAVAVCPTAAVKYSEPSAAISGVVEKVCLVGAGEDSYLRLHELVAPREGAPLDTEGVRADIEALFDQGLLKDVVVVAQPLPGKGVMLSYVVTEYEWISRVDFTGVTAVKTDDLNQLAHAGLRANPFLLKTISDQVQSLYEGLGYPQAKAVATVKSLGGGNSALTLAVEEGPQVRVAEITFEGAKKLAEVELRKSLRSVIGTPYLKDLVERDTLAITSAYFDHGMVNANVTNTTRPFAAGPAGAVEVVFQVKEGEVFRLGKLALTGFSIGAEKDLLKALEAKPKSVFSRAVLQRDMDRLRARAKEKGYVVEVTPLTTIDADKKIIDVAFELEKRPNPNLKF
jgi:outer membrane protein insertion porin family